jgi:hypothetical protein
MMHSIRPTLAFLTLFSLLAVPSLGSADSSINYNMLVADSDMLNTYAMDFDELEYFLRRGHLADYEGDNYEDVEQSAAEIIWDAAMQFELNPQFLLVLLQREQSLVEDDNPTEKQLDWAMGYAVCDDCSMDDPQIQKYKGFGNQVYYASKRIRESYLDDLDIRGYTVTSMGPGIEKEIDGMTIIPENYATSVLYTYTPHLHGNENFVYIWRNWFEHVYPTGTLIQDEESGGIWYIQFGRRRAITSKTAYYTRFGNQPVITASATTIEQYPEGDPINFPNYSLLRAPTGTVFLIVDDTRRGFASAEALRKIGFNSDEIIDVDWSDLDPYQEGEPITVETEYASGALLQNSTTGGVYYVENAIKHPLISRELMDVNFAGFSIIPTAPETLETYETGDAVGFPDGTLVIAKGSPDVFVISEGLRRPIPDEDTFLTYGWSWDDIIWTSERSVLLHDLGEMIASVAETKGESEEDLSQATL